MVCTELALTPSTSSFTASHSPLTHALTLSTPSRPHRYLVYSGQVELDSQRPTAVRTSITAACSHNLLDCLKELGFV